MTMPDGKEQKNGTGKPEDYPSEGPIAGGYGRFGDYPESNLPEEMKLPQLSIIPGMIATIIWVALMLWLASLPGGPLYLPEKTLPASVTDSR